MHELSIIQNILDISDQEVKKVNATQVDQIDLQIGTLSGIEMDAFIFAWEACVPDTVLEKAERIIHNLPAIAQCTKCQHNFETDNLCDQCPKCGDYLTELISGKELKIKSLVVS